MHFLSTIILSFSLLNNSANYYNDSRADRNYTDSLNKVVESLKENKIINESLLLYCIPETQEEASTFQLLDYQKDQLYIKIFSDINSQWINKCIEKNSQFIVKYLEYSQFVDGYFAEDYFDSISRIFNAIGQYLCSKLNDCDRNKIIRVITYFNENNYCKDSGDTLISNNKCSIGKREITTSFNRFLKEKIIDVSNDSVWVSFANIDMNESLPLILEIQAKSIVLLKSDNSHLPVVIFSQSISKELANRIILNFQAITEGGYIYQGEIAFDCENDAFIFRSIHFVSEIE